MTNASDDEQQRGRRTHSAAPNEGGTGTSLLLYRPDDVQRAIKDLGGQTKDWFVGPEDEEPARDVSDLSSEERLRLETLRRIASDKRGPRRRLIVGSRRMAERVARIRADAPHFSPFLELVERAVQLSALTLTPLRIPPVLLVGSPGIGKTYVLKRIAEAISSGYEFLAMTSIDSFRLRGLNTCWRGARIGRIAEALLKSPMASPIFVLDEFEKAASINMADRPFDIFHSLFEEENAEGFVDDFLEFPLRVDHVIWIASANSTVGLPASIFDRLLVLRISDPTVQQLRKIVDGVYASVIEPFDDEFEPILQDDVRSSVSRHNPRLMKRVLRLALAYATADDRLHLAIEDIERAVELAKVGRDGTFGNAVGFLA